ncbi:AIPR family protein [Mariprofundus ferrooxydans]|uniref:AIPR family protein n=1 Tax=Mariprofundus ferrooxydans TaxID=314344 RepID=UPI001430E1D8|nr:AIPR family protein [Mariprofundus ferrooxydans]
MSLEAYYNDLKQDVIARSSANEHFSEAIFTEYMAEKLGEVGELDDFDYCPYRRTGLRVDGYSFVEPESLLNLFITEYSVADHPETLTGTKVNEILKRAGNFFLRSLKAKFHQDMEESSPGFRLAQDIHSRIGSFEKVRFYLLTNMVLSDRVKEIPSGSVGGYDATFHIWDISRFYRVESSGREREDIVIDFDGKFGSSIPCLPAHLGSANYRSFLAVIPGDVLASLYDEYGQRLLEQNVRTFLQFRGNVNKGIRTTILNDPEMFFAYNNGITATAEDVTTSDSPQGMMLDKVVNLQVVNGGQTTASIFTSKRKDKADLSRVFVQMKLSVIDPEKSEEVVPKISEYANSQNKVNAADFFSNHPFHIQIESFSRRIWAPSAEGSQKETHWFYERARGQYLTTQSDMTLAKKKEFLIQNPRNQMFSKTDLAKYINTWAGLPHIVSLGAQKNFARFASEVGKEWEKDSTQVNELYFRHLVAKAILFRQTEKIVMKQSWYEGGYRANIVTYTIALMAKKVAETGNAMCFDEIWRRQSLSEVIETQIAELAKGVHEAVTDTPDTISNISEWCKKEQCWRNVQDQDLFLSPDFIMELQGREAMKAAEKDAKKVQTIDDGIICQKQVIEMGADAWKQLKSWNIVKNILTEKESSILSIATNIPRKFPSAAQSEVLMKALDRARSDGFVLTEEM